MLILAIANENMKKKKKNTFKMIGKCKNLWYKLETGKTFFPPRSAKLFHITKLNLFLPKNLEIPRGWEKTYIN